MKCGKHCLSGNDHDSLLQQELSQDLSVFNTMVGKLQSTDHFERGNQMVRRPVERVFQMKEASLFDAAVNTMTPDIFRTVALM